MDDTDRKDAAARASGVTLHSQQYRGPIYLIALMYEKGGGGLTGSGRAETADVDEVLVSAVTAGLELHAMICSTRAVGTKGFPTSRHRSSRRPVTRV
jgi:hypothetical protein